MTDKKPLILVIDDELPIRRFLRAALTNQGYELIEAVNGQDGITQIATRQPDIVLLDPALPDVDGLEITQQLREWTNVPIIVLSAREQEHDKVAALEAGGDYYLTKPFRAVEVTARIPVAL